ncbi:hypothetical protein [Kitasatospora sp. NPDC059571]|uniref:hypothetical protein n=1 Tax=Kitasatospora sp. NPDC059571 TaxID=3346871 RepID=UPI0036937F8B
MAAVELAWLACDLKSGRVAEELDLAPTQVVGRRLGGITSTGFNLALSGAPPEWEAATDPGRTLAVAVDKATGLIVWSGITLTRKGGASDLLQLAAATPECYLGRRYPGAYTAAGADLSTIMAALVAPAATDGPPLVLDTTVCGTTADYSTADGDDKTILSQLQTLAGMAGAPEMTIDTVWADAAQTAVQLAVRIKPAVGAQSATPEAVFDLPGCISDYSLTESYEDGHGATEVLATGEGEGSTRALSDLQTASALILGGYCRWSYRWSPGSGITSKAQLNAHATDALGLMQTGTKSWTVDATASAAPRLGRDWGLGDSVRIQIVSSPRHPAGTEKVARAYGWDLDPGADRVSPILLEE